MHKICVCIKILPNKILPCSTVYILCIIIFYVNITCLIAVYNLHCYGLCFIYHLFVYVSVLFRSKSNMSEQHMDDTAALALKNPRTSNIQHTAGCSRGVTINPLAWAKTDLTSMTCRWRSTSFVSWVTLHKRWRPPWGSSAWGRTPMRCWGSWCVQGPRLCPPVALTVMMVGSVCPIGEEAHLEHRAQRWRTRLNPKVTWSLLLLMAATWPWGEDMVLLSCFFLRDFSIEREEIEN